MKKYLLLALFFAATFTLCAQYQVQSDTIGEGCYMNGRYWYRIYYCDNDGKKKSVDCHEVEDCEGEDIVATFNIVANKRKFQKNVIFLRKSVLYTSALR